MTSLSPFDVSEPLAFFRGTMDNLVIWSIVIFSEERLSHDHVLSAESQRSMFSGPQ